MYQCNKCKKILKTHSGYSRHIKRNTCSKKGVNCEYCMASFKYQKNLNEHIKFSCQVLKEEEEQKKKEQEEQKRKDREELEILRDQLNEYQSKLVVLENMIKDPKIQIRGNNNNNQNNINNIQNIHLHIDPHGREKIDHLHDKLVNSILMLSENDPSGIIPAMIKIINIDNEQGRNVYLPNIRGDYGLVLEDNEWNVKDLETLIRDIGIDNMDRFDDLLREYEEKFVDVLGLARYNDLIYCMDKYFNRISKEKGEDQKEYFRRTKAVLMADRDKVFQTYKELTGNDIKSR